MIRRILQMDQCVPVPQPVSAFQARSVVGKVNDHIVVRCLCNPVHARTLRECGVLYAACHIGCFFCVCLHIVSIDVQFPVCCAAPHGETLPVNRKVCFVRQHDCVIFSEKVYQGRFDGLAMNGSFHQ